MEYMQRVTETRVYPKNDEICSDNGYKLTMCHEDSCVRLVIEQRSTCESIDIDFDSWQALKPAIDKMFV